MPLQLGHAPLHGLVHPLHAAALYGLERPLGLPRHVLSPEAALAQLAAPVAPVAAIWYNTRRSFWNAPFAVAFSGKDFKAPIAFCGQSRNERRVVFYPHDVVDVFLASLLVRYHVCGVSPPRLMPDHAEIDPAPVVHASVPLPVPCGLCLPVARYRHYLVQVLRRLAAQLAQPHGAERLLRIVRAHVLPGHLLADPHPPAVRERHSARPHEHPQVFLHLAPVVPVELVRTVKQHEPLALPGPCDGEADVGVLLVEPLRERYHVPRVVVGDGRELHAVLGIQVDVLPPVVIAPFPRVVPVPPQVLRAHDLPDDSVRAVSETALPVVLRVGLRRRDPLAAALETVELHALRDCAVHDDARLVVAAPDVGDRLRDGPLGLAAGRVVISVETRPAFAEEIVRLSRDPPRDRPEVQVPSLVTRLIQGIDVLEVLCLDRRAWSRVRVLVRRVRRISAPFPGRLEEAPRRLHVAAPHGVHVRRVLFGRDPAHREALLAVRPLVVDADVVVAERDVVPPRLVAVLHRLAVGVHRVLHPVDARAGEELRRRLGRAKGVCDSLVHVHAVAAEITRQLHAFGLRLPPNPLQLLVQKVARLEVVHLVPLQQVALVARRAVGEPRLLVDVLRNIGDFSRRYSVTVRLEPFIILPLAVSQFAVAVKKLVVFNRGVN